MTEATESYEDEYEEYDEFDEDGEERGLSGLAVLIMGVVMIGAFLSVIIIAYQQGIKAGRGATGTPYVAADPEPIKIESNNQTETVADREVYDVFAGDDEETVTVLAEGPEEPLDRAADDTIGALAAEAGGVAEDVQDEVDDRIASLAEEDAAVFDEPEPQPQPAATRPTPASASTNDLPVVRVGAADATSGTHVIQVGAFRSDEEAAAQWARMQSRLGDYLNGKSDDVERADLGDRGVYHRLRIGPFTSSDDASAFCAGLKERGQDCLVKSL